MALEQAAARGRRPFFGCPADASIILPPGDDCCGELPLAGRRGIGVAEAQVCIGRCARPSTLTAAQSDGGDTQSPGLSAPAFGCWRPGRRGGRRGGTRARVEHLVQLPKLPIGYGVQAPHRVSPKGLGPWVTGRLPTDPSAEAPLISDPDRASGCPCGLSRCRTANARQGASVPHLVGGAFLIASD